MLANPTVRGETPERLAAASEELMPLFPKTRKVFESAHQVVPDGFSRARFFWPIPLYIDRGFGARSVDIDGREYIDCLMGFGVMITGHDHPKVQEAVQARISKGTQFGVAVPQESELAGLIVENIPGADRVIFFNSGTEATLAALRIARSATGRTKVAKFEGGWHGANDYLQHSYLRTGGDVTRPEAMSETRGISPSVAAETIVLPYNNLAAADRIREEGDNLAAVIVEGVQGAAGSFPGTPEFLHAVQAACKDTGAVFIMDEVITAFRFGPGGVSGQLGLDPDLVTLGKVIGGGLPAGAIAGRQDLMESVIPDENHDAVLVAGTFAGNALTMVAGAAQLKVLLSEPEHYAHLDSLGDRLRAGVQDVLQSLGIKGHTTGTGSLWGLHLGTETPPTNTRESNGFRGTGGLALTGYLLREHVLMEAPIHLGFLSIAHTEDDIDQVVEAHERALSNMKKQGFFDE